jgi:hypothetical protein
MAAITHTFAYLRALPIAGTNITPSGGSALTTCRVVGPITEEREHRINNEDIDENGRLVGQYHDDLVTRISLSIKVPTGFTVPGINTTVTIASATALSNRYNGVWKITKSPIEFKSDDAAEVKLDLEKHENLTYT